MQIFADCYAILAVATTYCIRQAYLRRRERIVRERVAFLLCLVADYVPQSASPCRRLAGRSVAHLAAVSRRLPVSPPRAATVPRSDAADAR